MYTEYIITLEKYVSDHVTTKPVTATGVILCHDVEEEGLNCKVECLVLQKELCHEAQALAIDLVLLTIHLKHRRLAVTVMVACMHTHSMTCMCHALLSAQI